MNSVILIGRIANEIYTNGGSVTKFKLATKTGFDKEKGQDRIAYVPVTVFGLSDAQVETLEKGKQLAVRGTVSERSFEKNGETVYQTDVTVSKTGLTLL